MNILVQEEGTSRIGEGVDEVVSLLYRLEDELVSALCIIPNFYGYGLRHVACKEAGRKVPVKVDRLARICLRGVNPVVLLVRIAFTLGCFAVELPTERNMGR